MPLPDFTNPQTFPTYASLPGTDSAPPSDAAPHYLLAQIGENMTITRPTLVLADRVADQFAIMFDGKIDLAAQGLKKGNTAVVPWATRMGAKKEGGNGFIVVEENMFEMVKALPGSLEKVVEAGGRMREREGEDRCSCCGKGNWEELKRCARCGGVKYCGKDCQVKDWNDGHKADCKMMKAIREVWP